MHKISSLHFSVQNSFDVNQCCSADCWFVFLKSSDLTMLCASATEKLGEGTSMNALSFLERCGGVGHKNVSSLKENMMKRCFKSHDIPASRLLPLIFSQLPYFNFWQVVQSSQGTPTLGSTEGR